MKTFIIVCLCTIAVFGAPIEDEPSRPKRLSPAVEHIDERDELGQYTLKYITAEGTIVSEKGHFVPTADGKDQVLIYEGEFSFVGDDGKTYATKYKTDVMGAYQVEGDHLPKQVEAEPVPEIKEVLIASA